MPSTPIRKDDGSRTLVADAVADDVIADDGDVSLLLGDDGDEAALPTEARREGGDEDNEDDDDEEGSAEIQDYRGFAALVGAGTAAGSTAPAVSTSASASGSLPSRKPQISSQTIRKGEKDFEEHGTRAQQNALEQSRAVMESVLSYTRVHGGATAATSSGKGSTGSGGNDIIRGWYFPEVWQDEPEEETISKKTTEDTDDGNERRFAHTRHRVVMVETQRGTMFSSVGAVPGKPKWIPTLPKDQQPPKRPGFDRVWLLPEEALFLLERGSMELWWPLKEIEAILAGDSSKKASQVEDDEEEEEDGIPLSLQAAYALLMGPDNDPQHGRITLPAYQVYTHLRRSGYQVLRAVKTDPQTPLDAPLPSPQAPTSIWQWLFSLLSPKTTPTTPSQYLPLRPHAPNGPLVQPGLYRSYGPVYNQLRLIPPHRYDGPSKESIESSGDTAPPAESPFRVVFHVWKAGAASNSSAGAPPKPFSKIRPPPPDFYMAVADANTTGVPTLEQISELLASVPPLPASAHMSKRAKLAAQAQANQAQSSAQPAASNTTPSEQPSTLMSPFPGLPAVYRRLKLGRRCVIVAVVDHGIVNYMRFSDSTFNTDPLWPRFDAVASGKFANNKNSSAGSKNGAGKGKSGGGKNQKKKKTCSTKNSASAKAESDAKGSKDAPRSPSVSATAEKAKANGNK